MRLYILGRQPKLGLAELERVAGADNTTAFGSFAACVEHGPPALTRIGGSLKSVEIIHDLPYLSWKKLQQLLLKEAGALYIPADTGRHTLGLSFYDYRVPPKQLNALLLTVKKQLRTESRSIRIVEHKQTSALESATVIHNGLLQENGRELVVATNGERTLIGLTREEQDIDSYTERDRSRPKRDPKVGMLPPKLAQIITNLATGPLAPSLEHTVLDPFCGTGVILQEAGLMGYSAYGTDIEPRMIEFSQQNAAWATKQFDIQPPTLQVGDATSFQWLPGFYAVATEAYLGAPLTSLPDAEKLRRIIGGCNVIVSKFLQNLATQTPGNLSICLAVPAWQTSPGIFQHLPLIDDLEKLGYNQVDFTHVRAEDLLYYREDQIVARELLVITRK